MSVIKFFLPENRLSAVIGGPEDPTLEVLARRAEARVQAIGDSLRTHIVQLRKRIVALGEQPEEEIFAQCYAIGDIALAICEVAGSAGMAKTGEAARGIYAMVQALINEGVWHTDALLLHIDALTLLGADPHPTREAADNILQGLKAMRRNLKVVE